MASLGGGLFRLGKRTSWVAALTRNLYVSDPASSQDCPQYSWPAGTTQRHGRWAHVFCSFLAIM